jgi:DNA (cytosine-5)-methyltransferase 1
VFKLLPSHARRRQRHFPAWKIRFIRKNREFYQRHIDLLEAWTNQIKAFPSSFQKLEWNCQEPNPLDEDRRLGLYVIQVRPSGVRVKRPNTAPSLVAMTTTQVPIIMWEGRYMTLMECKSLQSMETLRFLPDKLDEAYAALGNAVNVHIAQLVAESLVGYGSNEDNLEPSQAEPQKLSPMIQSVSPLA